MVQNLQANFMQNDMQNDSHHQTKQHIQQCRKVIRQQSRAKRKQYSQQQQQLFSTQLLKQLTSLNMINNVESIAIYLANDGELDAMPFIHWCWQHNINVYLPVLHPFCSGHLLFLQYSDQTPLVLNSYGIKEPKLNVNCVIPAHQLDIIFTPLVAFDRQGNRLGMGGGFYDRTLQALNSMPEQSKRPQVIGLAHNCQLIDKIPTESWDMPLNEIITPDQHYYCQPN